MSTTYISDTLLDMMGNGIVASDLDWLDKIEKDYWLTEEESDLVQDLKREFTTWLETFGGNLR